MIFTIGTLTGSQTGLGGTQVSFYLSYNHLLILFGVGLVIGFVYNVAINRIGNQKHVMTWKWVSLGVILAMLLLSTIHFILPVILFVVMAGLGLPLILGDEARAKTGLKDYAKLQQEKSKIRK
ncbi:MAG: hypothetical protein AAF490_02940 [Chloroflexota bacterium]